MVAILEKGEFNTDFHPMVDFIAASPLSTQKFENKVDELRAVSDHMLGAFGVQIIENNLDNLKLTREEDGAVETLDPQFWLGFELLEMLDSTPLDLLLKLIMVTSFIILGLFLRGVVFFATFVRSGFL
nr:hypothetical protein [Tanacetum cinerariifolium]